MTGSFIGCHQKMHFGLRGTMNTFRSFCALSSLVFIIDAIIGQSLGEESFRSNLITTLFSIYFLLIALFGNKLAEIK
jgi:hypothetical protein